LYIKSKAELNPRFEYFYIIFLCLFRKLVDLEALNTLDTDSTLRINMSAVHYIHTKRFSTELHVFVKDLLQLQTVIQKYLSLVFIFLIAFFVFLYLYSLLLEN